MRAPDHSARRLISAYSESGQIPAYAVTSALVPISSNSGVSHFWSSMAITSFRTDSIVQVRRVLTDPARSPPSSPVNQITVWLGATPSRTGDVPLLYWVTYLLRHPVPGICAYSSGSAKTKMLDPRDPPISPGRNPSTQAPQPTGTAMYCLPSML